MNERWAFKLIKYGYEPSVTDANKANEQYTNNVRLQHHQTNSRILLKIRCWRVSFLTCSLYLRDNENIFQIILLYNNSGIQVLEKDGEDQMDRSFEKWSIAWSQGAEDYPTWNKQTEG
jgi:hypothetical protein